MIRCIPLAAVWLSACTPQNITSPSAEALAELKDLRSPSTWEVLEAGETPDRPRRLRDPRTGLEFVRIPAGSFTMGGSRPDELPRHTVHLTRDFYLSTTEFHGAARTRYVETYGGARDSMGNPTSPTHPVTDTSWRAAKEACDTFGYRLPTEAEWEYASRAGRGENGPWIDVEQLEKTAWIPTNSEGTVQPVGILRANPFGLYDMLGNVWEWCADGVSYGYSPDSDGSRTDPFLEPGAGNHSVRGGSWFTTPPAHPGDRMGAKSEETSSLRGFRPAVDA